MEVRTQRLLVRVAIEVAVGLNCMEGGRKRVHEQRERGTRVAREKAIDSTRQPPRGSEQQTMSEEAAREPAVVQGSGG